MRRGILWKIFVGVCVLFLYAPTPTWAQEGVWLKSLIPVFSIENKTGLDENCTGDLMWSNFTYEDEVLGLEPELRMYNAGGCRKNGGGRIKLIAGNKECMSFPVNQDESVKADLIQTNQKKAFLLIRTYKDSANGSSSCKNMWLIGKTGDGFVTYATKATLDQAGLVYDDIVPKVHDGQLEIMSIARCYAMGVNGTRGPIGEKYRGHKIHILDSWYAAANSVYFFWDENAQWFGFRLVE